MFCAVTRLDGIAIRRKFPGDIVILFTKYLELRCRTTISSYPNEGDSFMFIGGEDVSLPCLRRAIEIIKIPPTKALVFILCWRHGPITPYFSRVSTSSSFMQPFSHPHNVVLTCIQSSSERRSRRCVDAAIVGTHPCSDMRDPIMVRYTLCEVESWPDRFGTKAHKTGGRAGLLHGVISKHSKIA
jgi:hypothetical protein